MDEDGFPEPLPPLRKAQIVRSKTSSKCQCAVCCRNAGLLTCTACKAVRYCGTDCQRKQWKEHKQLCGLIKKMREEVEAFAEPLTRFRLSDNMTINIFQENLGILEYDGENIGGSGVMQSYASARMGLIDLLKECGVANRSNIAFELAAENSLDLMVLSYREGPWRASFMEFVSGMMITSEMDQEAYNYIRYFSIRYQLDYSIPYLHVEDQDIEENLVLDQLDTRDMTNIALIKYKRMKRLMFDTIELDASWKNFLMGTHPVVGEKSVVKNIRGLTLVVEQLKRFVYSNIYERTYKLSRHIYELLTEVSERNEFALPGILEPHSIPPITYDDSYWSLSEKEKKADNKARDAISISDNSSFAWMKATVIDDYLNYFIHNGEVIDPETFNREALVASFGLLGLELKLDFAERAKISLLSCRCQQEDCKC